VLIAFFRISIEGLHNKGDVMSDTPARVFVPTAVEANGKAIGMGCFSTEETAWQVLRSFLKKSDIMELASASVVIWEIDIIGDDAMTVLSTIECKPCPVCKRNSFWVDLNQFSALCYGPSCAAWVEESTVEPGVIDCGWPAIQFLKQAGSIKEAFQELYKLGDRLTAAGQTEQVAGTAEGLLGEFQNS
jgi:hypothetical protein